MAMIRCSVASRRFDQAFIIDTQGAENLVIAPVQLPQGPGIGMFLFIVVTNNSIGMIEPAKIAYKRHYS